jgi:hypothetical protein
VLLQLLQVVRVPVSSANGAQMKWGAVMPVHLLLVTVHAVLLRQCSPWGEVGVAAAKVLASGFLFYLLCAHSTVDRCGMPGQEPA